VLAVQSRSARTETPACQQTPKIVALIEGNRRGVLGIDSQREYSRLGTRRAYGRIHHEGATEPLPLIFLSDGETADQSSGQKRIARQALLFVS
jgi:hypothetical protein